MGNLIFKNILLFIPLVAISTWFALGYASKSGSGTALVLIYSITAIVQIGVNCLIYKKQIVSDRKVLLKIIAIIVVMYVLYPLVFSVLS